MYRHALPTAFLLTVALLAPATGIAGEAPDLIANGLFTELDGKGLPSGWDAGGRPEMVRQDGNTWIRVGKGTSLGQRLRLSPDIAKLKLSVRMRTAGVLRGRMDWQDARLALEFRDEAGKHVDPWPDSPHAVGDTPWTIYERELRVPTGAATFSLGCSMLGDSGTAEFDDIHVSVLRLRSRSKDDAPLPAGADEPWDMARAQRERSATRERICINGLWRFRPLLAGETDGLPGANEGWGWFKVPGMWAGGAQTQWLSGLVEDRLQDVSPDQAWYQRTFTAPADWQGARMLLDFTMVQTHARVFIDGRPAGEVWFPGGRLDISEAVRPGTQQVLAVLLTARPLETEATSFSAPDRVTATRATVARKGLTGDVFLVREPRTPTIDDVRIDTSTRKAAITFAAQVTLAAGCRYVMKARVLDGDRIVKTCASEPFDATHLRDGRFAVADSWADAKRWDLDTPGNLYRAVLTLCDADGAVLDETLPTTFGFREFWCEGRDFMLNGTPLHLRALFTTNIASAADLACLPACERTCQEMQKLGFNALITSNYSFEPGEVGYLDALFTATDRLGLVAAFSLPHGKDFNWKMDDPRQQERYRQLCAFLVRRAQNHPSIMLYSMNHNATGYYGDQNPLKMDGRYAPAFPPDSWSGRNRHQARIAAGIAKALDPTRPVYHHQSGNLEDVYTVNCYLNWAPLQERSDWLEHWSTQGVKPLFFVEWGLPHISSWSSFRGPQFIWRHEAFQQVWDSEFAAAYLGQRAYRMTERKIAGQEHEERLFAAGKPFPWSTLIRHLKEQDENYREVQALMCDDNWRSHRAWGISAMLPWDQEGLWRRVRPPANPTIAVPDAMKDLQRPGIVPDVLRPGGQVILTCDPENYEPTVLGRSFARWNRPLLGWIGGGPDPLRFTGKDHVFHAGETVAKQLVLLNDTRRDITCHWSCALGTAGFQREGHVVITPGARTLVPLAIPLPADCRPDAHVITARFDFGQGEVQEDRVTIDVLATGPLPPAHRVALYDPQGSTKALLDRCGIPSRPLAADGSPADDEVLVVGRQALTTDGPMPLLDGVADGRRILVLEQDAEVLARRFGFRINIHGERKLFARLPDHPALAGLTEDHLHDWRGAATLVPPHLDTPVLETGDPRWRWCGFSNTRVWRCGNQGNVASVLIEKPERGDFRPILDGSFDLQYAPLLEHVDGKGRIIFCQLDVTGRTDREPAAERLLVNLCRHLEGAAPTPTRRVLYAGGDAGTTLLADLGVRSEPFAGQPLDAHTLLVLGPKPPVIPAFTAALDGGLNVLGLGLDAAEVDALLPGRIRMKTSTIVPSLVERFTDPALAGISNAELHWRTRLELPAFMRDGDGPCVDGHEVLRVVRQGKGVLVLDQAPPWRFDYAAKPYVRTTFRRTSFLAARLLANLGAPFARAVAYAAEPPVTDIPLPAAWTGRTDPDGRGDADGWQRPEYDATAWKPVQVGKAFNGQDAAWRGYLGAFWYRLDFPVPAGAVRDGLVLDLGAIDDESWVWLNGRLLGEVSRRTDPKDHWNRKRTYVLPPDALKRGGANVLVVKANNLAGSGGMLSQPALAASAGTGWYLQQPIAEDDPFRYYRW